MTLERQRASAQIDWDAWMEERRETFETGVSFNVHCGLKMEAAGPGWARMRMPLTPEMFNPFGSVHGGATSALIDSVAGSAISAGTHPDDRIMGTIDLQVHYLRRAMGSALVAEGRMVRAGKAVAVATVEVRDDRDELVAIGTASYRLGPPGMRRNED